MSHVLTFGLQYWGVYYIGGFLYRVLFTIQFIANVTCFNVWFTILRSLLYRVLFHIEFIANVTGFNVWFTIRKLFLFQVFSIRRLYCIIIASYLNLHSTIFRITKQWFAWNCKHFRSSAARCKFHYTFFLILSPHIYLVMCAGCAVSILWFIRVFK